MRMPRPARRNVSSLVSSRAKSRDLPRPEGGRSLDFARDDARDDTRDDTLLLAGLGILIYLLSATVVWLHYMVLVLPLAIALLRDRRTAVVSVVALLAIAEEPFEWLTKTQIYPNDAWLIGPALVALFIAGVWQLNQRPRPAG